MAEDKEMLAQLEEMNTLLAAPEEGQGDGEADPTDEQGTEEAAAETEGTEQEEGGNEGEEGREEGGEEGGEGAREEGEEGEGKEALVERLFDELRTVQQQLAALREAQPKPEPAAPEEIDFLEGKSIDDVASNEKTFNAFLNKVYRRARQDAEESTLRAMPNVVKASITQQTTLKEKVDQFYTKNKDLSGFRKAVAAVAQEVAGEHPDWSVDRVFDAVGKEARRRLGLKGTVAAPAGKPRGFAKGGQSPRSAAKPNLSDLEREIAEMNRALKDVY